MGIFKKYYAERETIRASSQCLIPRKARQMLQHPFKCLTELSKFIWVKIMEETENQTGRADSTNGLGDGVG